MRQILLLTLVCLVFVGHCFGISDSEAARLKEIVLELENINNMQLNTIDELQKQNTEMQNLSDSKQVQLNKQNRELKELANSYRKQKISWAFSTVAVTVVSFSTGYMIGRYAHE